MKSMNEEPLRLIYAIVLAVAGLLLVTGRNRITEFRNRHALDDRDKWGKAEPRRYLIFGIAFILLAILSLVRR